MTFAMTYAKGVAKFVVWAAFIVFVFMPLFMLTFPFEIPYLMATNGDYEPIALRILDSDAVGWIVDW